jgi:hypothetical protein
MFDMFGMTYASEMHLLRVIEVERPAVFVPAAKEDGGGHYEDNGTGVVRVVTQCGLRFSYALDPERESAHRLHSTSEVTCPACKIRI